MTQADAVLDGAFTRLLSKVARPNEQQQRTTRTASLNFGWGGGGQAITVATCDPVLLEIPFASTIVWAHLWAGDASGAPLAVTANVSLRLHSLASFALFGASMGVFTGGLTTLPAADIDITSWGVVNLIAGDALIAHLDAFTGSATWLTFTLQLRSNESDQGVADVVDDTGNQLTDASGNNLVFRS